MLGDTARKVVSLPGLKNNKSFHFVQHFCCKECLNALTTLMVTANLRPIVKKKLSFTKGESDVVQRDMESLKSR